MTETSVLPISQTANHIVCSIPLVVNSTIMLMFVACFIANFAVFEILLLYSHLIILSLIAETDA